MRKNTKQEAVLLAEIFQINRNYATTVLEEAQNKKTSEEII